MEEKIVKHPTAIFLPVLPLKNIVALPKSIIPVVVGRDLSIQAIEAAMRATKEVFVTAQKSLDIENPTPSDIYHYGTRALVLQAARMPNGTLKILIEGVARSRIVEVTQTEKFIGVLAQDLVSLPLENTSENVGLWRNLFDLFKEYVSLNEKINTDVLGMFHGLNDLDYLDDIADDKYIEMALSFDREYTIEDAEKMLPESITVTWYWIDDLSGNEKEFLKIPRAEQLEMEQPIYIPYVRSEYTAYGIKLHYNDGVMINDPAESFINIITERMTEFRKGNEFERIHSNIAGNNGELTKDDIKIWGAVVTGDPESLKVLAGLPFIRASSLGVVTDKY